MSLMYVYMLSIFVNNIGPIKPSRNLQDVPSTIRPARPTACLLVEPNYHHRHVKTIKICFRKLLIIPKMNV